MNYKGWTILCAAAMAGAAFLAPHEARAHPHVFAEARLEVVVGDGGAIDALRHVWRFDDLFSSTVLFEFDLNRDLQLDNEELEVVGEVIHESLADFDYFQFISVDGRDVTMRPPERIIASFDEQLLTIAFESAPAEQVSLSGSASFGVYDPTFYTAIDFYEDEMMTASGLPDACGTSVVRPDPDEAIAMNQESLTDAFFNEPGGVDYGQLFATRLEVDCSGVAPVQTAEAQPARRSSPSSLGIGVAETTVPQTGLFSGVTNWIAARQQEFYRTLTTSLRSMRDGGGGLWLLIGMSFAYGVFHAAGPGHGKAVISSYMLANEVALRRGVMLSFVSAALQGLTALVLMSAVYLVLRGTTVSMTNATLVLERASYVLVMAFGAWLLWRKAAPPLISLFGRRRAHSLSAARTHDHDHHHHHHAHGHDHHHHQDGESCATCGHAHAPDPKLLSGDRFDWRTAWAAIVAVGLRPCTGALVVLSFAFLNGLLLGGVLSVAAMSLGTAITVSALAILAVTAKNVAVNFAGGGRAADRVHLTIEIAGASFVFLLGVLLLTASLSV